MRTKVELPSWHARPRGRLFGEEALPLTGAELLRGMMDKRWSPPPLTLLADLRVSDVGLGAAAMAMPASGWWQSAAGVFTAGVLAFLADGALGAAVMTAAPPGVGMTTTGMAINFVRPATTRSISLVGRGRVVHATERQALSEASLLDGRGRLLAHGTSRGLLFRLDPAAVRENTDAAEADDAEPPPFRQDPEGEVFGQDYFNARSGMDILEELVRGEFLPPVMRFLGSQLSSISPGRAELLLPATRWLLNAYGVLYGGAIALVADLAMNSALWTLLPKGTSFAPLDLSINYIRAVPADAGDLRFHASVTHPGRTVAVVSCEVVDPRDKLVASAVETILVLPGRPWERPVNVGNEVPMEQGR